MAKEGSTIGGLMDSLGTAISVALQYGVPVESLVNKFAHQRFEPMGMTSNRDIPFAKSLVDYIFRWLGMQFIVGYRDANSPQRDASPSTSTGSGSSASHSASSVGTSSEAREAGYAAASGGTSRKESNQWTARSQDATHTFETKSSGSGPLYPAGGRPTDVSNRVSPGNPTAASIASSLDRSSSSGPTRPSSGSAVSGQRLTGIGSGVDRSPIGGPSATGVSIASGPSGSAVMTLSGPATTLGVEASSQLAEHFSDRSRELRPSGFLEGSPEVAPDVARHVGIEGSITRVTHTDIATDIITADGIVHTESHSDTVVRSRVPYSAASASALDQSNATLMGDAPACDTCGSITVRNGTCYRCLNCGASLGCS